MDSGDTMHRGCEQQRMRTIEDMNNRWYEQ